MTSDQPKNLSPAEWKVMKIVWSLESGAARDIHRIAKTKHGMTLGATKNVLFRLVEKGHLETQQVGNSYLYQPVSTMLDSICQAADELLDDTSESAAESLMLHLAKKGRLSGKGVKNLRSLLDERKERAGD